MVRTTSLSPLGFILGEYIGEQQPPTWRAYRARVGGPAGLPYAICPITPLKEFHFRPTLRMRKLRLSETTRLATDLTKAEDGGFQVCLNQSLSFQSPRSGGSVGPGKTGENPRPRGCPVRTSAKGPRVWAGPHLDDERVLKTWNPARPPASRSPCPAGCRPRSGAAAGWQIWLTVRRTGGFFFFHRVRSRQEFLASGILGWLESPALLDSARFPAWGGQPREPEQVSPQSRDAPPRPRGRLGRRAPSGGGVPTSRSPTSLRGELRPTKTPL